MILVTHAYSRRNSGDGLLVDATLDLLGEAGVDEEVHVLALDAASFPEIEHISQISATAGGIPALLRGGATLGLEGLSAAHLPLRSELTALFQRARLIVAVGGGYLRAGNPREAAKTTLAHLPQLLAAGSAEAPALYLPQSIGPLHGPGGAALRAGLRRVQRVWVRDDTSLRELAGNPAVRRAPDLALLRIAGIDASVRPRPGGPVALVARALEGAPGYEDRLKRLADLLPGAVWAVQSEGRGNDDRSFYRRLGLGAEHPPLAELLAAEPRGTVVSVRLHGSLDAVIHGWSSVHLSYERKGAGAYGDLGLERYLFESRSFDPRHVAETTEELVSHPDAFWDQVAAAQPRLRGAREEILGEIRAALA